MKPSAQEESFDVNEASVFLLLLNLNQVIPDMVIRTQTRDSPLVL